MSILNKLTVGAVAALGALAIANPKKTKKLAKKVAGAARTEAATAKGAAKHAAARSRKVAKASTTKARKAAKRVAKRAKR